MTTPNAGENGEKLDVSYTASGTVKWYSHYRKQFSSFLKKLNRQLPYDPAIAHLAIYPRDMKTYKNLYVDVHSSFIYISQKLESTQISFNRQMVKQIVVHPHHGTLLSNKKEQTTDTCNNSYGSPGAYANWKKPIPKDYILYDPIYITFWMTKLYQ